MEAVCFDMDGVVVDSEQYWAAREEEVILPAALGDEGIDASAVSGMNLNDTYHYLRERYDVEVSEAEFVDLYDEAAEEIYYEKAELMDGFRDLVGDLRDRGATVALVSSSPRRFIDMVFDRFDLEGCFDEVVSAEDIDAESKPAPDIYRHAADAVEVDIGDCVAVEDTENGVEAAVNAGMDCIAYRADDGDQDVSAATAVVEGPEELRTELLARFE